MEIPNHPAAAQRVEETLQSWKRKLLDLSRRNRLLNFKVTQVSTVTVVDELPVEVFRQLHLRRQTMRFRPLPEQEALGLERTADGDEVTEPEDLEGEDAPVYASVVPEAKHTDSWLQTNLTRERLDRSLRRIHDQAQLTLEEQGVNTLFLTLGMLHFFESDDSQDLRRAPLLLLPVHLERTSARAAYTLSATDDEPLINPALAEYLRRDFGVKLPELPEMTDEYDPASLFDEIVAAIARYPRWEVANQIYLGLLSFQKFVMYKDLERNRDVYAGHRLIHSLATRSGQQHVGLPTEIRGMDLDEEQPPEKSFHVVDADSSQQRAIAAVVADHDLVIEGPPGTGKSQTITNLIARALAEEKSVLFVAEKMAALQVVYSRLAGVGLADFCLELHSHKANKRAVITDLARSLDASLAPYPNGSSSGPRLAAVRHQLTEYAEAVHTPYGALQMSPYEGYGRLAEVKDAPQRLLRRRVDDITREELDQTLRALDDLAVAVSAVGDPATHPWRDSTRSFYPEDVRLELREILPALRTELEELDRLAGEVERSLGIPRLERFSELPRTAEVARLLAGSPGASPEVLSSEAWNSPPPLALQIVETGRRVQTRMREAQQRFRVEVLERDHADEAAVIERLHTTWYRMFVGDYRQARRAWLDYRLPGYTATLGEQVAHMREVDALRQDRAFLREHGEAARTLFGTFWQGEASAWEDLEAYIRWVVEFRSACVRHGLREQAIASASRPHPDTSRVEQMRVHHGEADALLGRLRAAVGFPADYLADQPVQQIAQRAAAMQEGLGLLVRWAGFAAAQQRVASGPAAELLEPAMQGELLFPALSAAFARTFFQKWLDEVVPSRPPLLEFHSLTHEQRIEEFRHLDQRVLRENRAALIGRLRSRVQDQLQEREFAPAMDFLRRQMARQRGHAPLRTTLHKAHAAIKAIKPCFMMSPLTVAQYLDPGDHAFDLVIFDEASQLPPEDSVGAIVRGRRLVVVGDPKQLPPTNFFQIQTGQVDVPLGEDGQPLVDDMESILEEFMAAGVPKSRLRWHYRSKHESLIAFSNTNFYDKELFTFPSVETDTRQRGLRFEYVAEGLYEGKGVNHAEARRVADAVVEHIKQHPELTLGVGTFNLRQQLAIQDELELRRRQDPSLEPFFAPRVEGGFFVKNLENIQGDDRDVIFLSVTYGKGADGALRHNFGPINGENGWRRLNVLTTRSRLRMVVFSSMRGDEIDLTRVQAQGARFLREFLIFAERGTLTSVLADGAAQTESPFEREVYQELTRRGLRLVPQVGLAGYRIDFGVLDDEVEGRFLCGIECDGASYHSAETARDRDRLRQQVLEELGWTIHRLWSTDWFKDREGQIERLLAAVEQSRLKVREPDRSSGDTERGIPLDAGNPAGNVNQPLSSPSDPLTEEGVSGPGVPLLPSDPIEPFPVPEYPQPSSSLLGSAYQFASLRVNITAAGLLAAPDEELHRAIREVVAMEAPIHIQDLAARLASAWGQKAGARIRDRIDRAVRQAEEWGMLRLRGDFVWDPEVTLQVRVRAGTGIPAERIAPEEYREAVAAVLRATGARPRKELVNDVRLMFGFIRTGAKLEASIGSAVDEMLAAGVLGEGSAGLRLRS